MLPAAPLPLVFSHTTNCEVAQLGVLAPGLLAAPSLAGLVAARLATVLELLAVCATAFLQPIAGTAAATELLAVSAQTTSTATDASAEAKLALMVVKRLGGEVKRRIVAVRFA